MVEVAGAVVEVGPTVVDVGAIVELAAGALAESIMLIGGPLFRLESPARARQTTPAATIAPVMRRR